MEHAVPGSLPGSGFNALILAGDRSAADPVARHAGVACKAAVPVAGVPLLNRVIAAVRGVPRLGRIVVVGPAQACMAAHPSLTAAIETPGVTRLDPEPSPSRSAAKGLQALGNELPVLITTADHALLTAPLAARFISASLILEADLAVGLIDYDRVAAAFPGVRRTVLRFGDGYCTCNLFAVLTRTGNRVIKFWTAVEQQRKNPARLVAGILGVAGLVRYLVGAMTLDDALSRASRRLGARIAPVMLDDPEASIDVDTPDDLRRVEAILAQRAGRLKPA
ncbi:MAG: NTP transferase domain-containing protein [Gammaproteobacteria bacterium]|nr:NTP transferase domain-containing protein [Gammaproteobacteria bacterium]